MQVKQAALNNFYLERIIQTKLQHVATIRYNSYVSLEIATDVRCYFFPVLFFHFVLRQISLGIMLRNYSVNYANHDYR